jgi:hypothetical protein
VKEHGDGALKRHRHAPWVIRAELRLNGRHRHEPWPIHNGDAKTLDSIRHQFSNLRG